MCGVVGIIANDPVNQAIYDALTMIQHRGQEAAGMMTVEGNQVFLRKGSGLVRDVIRTPHMLSLRGNMGLGHIRYPTAGSFCPSEAQPFYVNSPLGLAIAHNGNIINADSLRDELIQQDGRHLNTQSDSEIVLNIFAHALQQLRHRHALSALSPAMLFDAVKVVHQRCQGAYAVVILIIGHGLIAFRDPNGIRPLVFGQRHPTSNAQRTEYMVASETVALDTLNFDFVAEVAPGEAVFFSQDGRYDQAQCAAEHAVRYAPCIFEYVYLARPDSVIGGVSVYQARLRMGERLAARIAQQFPVDTIDVVVPIPETSRTAALPLAGRLGLPYREGFIKNRYVGRTFIMPGQALRQQSLRQKLNVIEAELRGKNVLLVDDSIVRGSTSRKVIAMARQAGAKKVFFASVSPLIRFPNVYGIDMPTCAELAAYQRSVDQICQDIGADALIFQTLEDLYAAIRSLNPALAQFEDAMFTGAYLHDSINPTYFAHLAASRGQSHDKKKTHRTDDDISGEGKAVSVYHVP